MVDGPVVLGLSGSGEVAPTERVDPLYAFDRVYDLPVEQRADLALLVNGIPIAELVDGLPDYDDGHSYVVVIENLDGPIVLDIADGYRADNDGDWLVEIVTNADAVAALRGS